MKFGKLNVLAVGAFILWPLGVGAESNSATGASGTAPSASASVDFQVTIPRFVFLRVGTAGPTVDLVEFDAGDRLTAGGFPGDGTDVAGTGGDAGGGAVNVQLRGNGGDITLSISALDTALLDGNGNSIPYSEILTSVTSGTLTPPDVGVGPGSVTVTADGQGRVNQDALWTYSFDNADLYPPGVYGGAGINGGRITYTAAIP